MTKMSDLRDPKKYNNQHFDLMGIVSKQTNKLFNIIFFYVTRMILPVTK